MKKLMGILLAASMVFSLAACGSTADTAASSAAGTTATAEGSSNNQAPDVKVGAIILGDETEGYSAAHINGIKEAAAELGMSDDQIVWKYKIAEGGVTADAAEDLVGQGCNLIISNSYGHQTYMEEEAEKYPDINFVAMTGDFAAISDLDNFYNAFTAVYQSRYVSGVVAGMKVKELVESGTLTPETQPDSFTADGKVKIGYVGAYNYAEVVSGYTAFFLGVQSVYPDVQMEVMYTNSWFDIDKEGAAAEALIANGAVIIGQHADSTGAPAATQKLKDSGKICYSIGYNIDMLDTAPTAALTSATNVWKVYYKELFEHYGFRNYFNQNTYIWRVNDSEANRQIFARTERLMATPGYRFENIDMRNLEEAAENFRIIYNKAWALFSGVKPMDKAQAQQLMRSMKSIIDPDIIIFAYFNDEPIGFFITVPDLNRLIGKFNGKFGLIQKLRMLWDLKVRKASDRIFGIIFGIAPEFHGKGVESGMMRFILEKYMRTPRNHYKTIEFAWVGDFNPVMNRMIESYVCATRHKMHTTYRYLFDRTKEFHRCPRLGVKRRE